jgi:hypothetical protein
MLKSAIAVDQRLPDNLIVAVEFGYSKNIRAVHFENVNQRPFPIRRSV